ncbi:nitroreductase family protein [Saccharothrix sp. ALI-22-I]|uniref:nitroreductase family protein n=1 Tax=Saccharothrix sp. ALI-22-I TaxID=1933778 RepID=UPI001EE6A881|nr:nitroreductase family protein [Saccharothrix sp. ALI-22-I]
MLDLLMNRRTRHVVTVDLHAAVMPRTAALMYRARMPLELVRMLRAVRRDPRRPQVTPPARRLPERLAAVLDGARLAPSVYNAQPWRFELSDDRTVRLSPDLRRRPGGRRRREFA